MRGDPDFGAQIFKAIGLAWKKLFKLPVESLAALGVSSELRQFAVDACGGLQKMLRSYGHKDWEGTGVTVYKFSYIIQTR